jgi:transcriptional regulator with XRE-family HTH domain
MLMAFVAITQISHCPKERLTRDAGVDKTVVSKIERGVTNPSLDVLLRLANHLEVHVGQLLLPHERLK